jgi:hypothetical protein
MRVFIIASLAKLSIPVGLLDVILQVSVILATKA